MAHSNSGPRLAIKADDKSGLVVIVTAIWVSWTALTLLIRLVSKLHVQKSIGLEEVMVVFASMFASIASSCVLVAVKHGLGRKDPDSSAMSHSTVFKLLWIMDIFYLITLAVAKGAALPLLTQLTPIKSIRLFCYGLSSVLAAWCIMSVMVIGSRCHSLAPWNDVSGAHCPSLYGRWVAVEVLSILFECTFFTLFVRIISILRMQRSAKAKVIFAYAVRLTIIVPTALRLVYLKQSLESTINTTFSSVNAIAATQTVMHYTTMAASFAYIKPFLRAFDSNLGATVKVDTIVSNATTSCPQSSRQAVSSNEHVVKLTNIPIRHPASEQLDSIHDYNSSFEDDTRPIRAIVATSDHSATNQQSRKASQQRFDRVEDKTECDNHDSTMGLAPIIYKTQEWTIHTEVRDEV